MRLFWRALSDAPIFALALFIAACGGQQATSQSFSPADHQSANDTPGGSIKTELSAAATPSPYPTSSSTVVWQAGSATIGLYEPGDSGSGQCGVPMQGIAAVTFTFPLTSNYTASTGGTCYRNQANPLSSPSSLWILANGTVYDWQWSQLDGPSPGMGEPTHPVQGDADSLVWQIHGFVEPHTPCIRLVFQNGDDDLGGHQEWGLTSCTGISWHGPYTPGETDSWEIKAHEAGDSTGWVELYRNGVFKGHFDGPTFNESSTVTTAFWNFGPYKWLWQSVGGGGSLMTSINQTMSNMTLRTIP